MGNMRKCKYDLTEKSSRYCVVSSNEILEIETRKYVKAAACSQFLPKRCLIVVHFTMLNMCLLVSSSQNSCIKMEQSNHLPRSCFSFREFENKVLVQRMFNKDSESNKRKLPYHKECISFQENKRKFMSTSKHQTCFIWKKYEA